MPLPAPFEMADEHVAIALPGARAVFTTRHGGVSRGPFASLNLGRWTEDDPGCVEQNRDLLARRLGVDLVYGRQVHGASVARVRTPPGDEPVEADGQATPLPGLGAMVLTADCLPIAIARPGAVAMVHAGWRGLAAGVVAEGVAAVRELADKGPLSAAIGPGAGACCYEVGEEVHAAFAETHPQGRSGANLDLKAIARAELERAGVDEVHDCELCTICSDPELFFSHRRERGLTGRQAGIAWRI